ELSKDLALTLIPDPRPQLQTNRRTPGGIPSFYQSRKLRADTCRPGGAQRLDPDRCINQHHGLASPDLRSVRFQSLRLSRSSGTCRNVSLTQLLDADD